MPLFGKRRRRAQLRNESLGDEWWEIVRGNVRYVERLPEEQQRELGGLIRIFLDEKTFDGAGGLVVTDEMRLTIAAQACILLLNRGVEVPYPDLRSIVVYPAAFVAPVTSREGGVQHEGFQSRLGESWDRGTVVISWRDALSGGLDDEDGMNVVFHEFAHELDHEWVYGEGVPELPDAEMYAEWKEVMSREYARLVSEVDAGIFTIIDPYAASGPAEFFAVVTEHFFEEPSLLKKHHAELYDLYRRYFRQDPAVLYAEGTGDRAGAISSETDPASNPSSNNLERLGEIGRHLRRSRRRPPSSPGDQSS